MIIYTSESKVKRNGNLNIFFCSLSQERNVISGTLASDKREAGAREWRAREVETSHAH